MRHDDTMISIRHDDVIDCCRGEISGSTLGTTLSGDKQSNTVLFLYFDYILRT